MDASALSANTLIAHSAILIYLLAVVGFAVGGLVFWWIIRPRRPSEEKLTTYECGETPEGSAWVQFNVRFYVFALVFVIFDVEAAFLLPWAVVFKTMGELAPVAFFEGVVFILILVVALAYVWRKGDLAWVRPDDRGGEEKR
jgi:NADH-quinone oxidoreductase subunit A